MNFARKTPLLVSSVLLILFLLWAFFGRPFGSSFRLPDVRKPPVGKEKANKRLDSPPLGPAKEEKGGATRQVVEIGPEAQGEIKIRVFTYGGSPLPGVQVFAVPSTARWLPGYGPKLGATGPEGSVALTWDSSSKGREKTLLLVKTGFLNQPIFHPLPGKHYKILMEPSRESILYTRDRFGTPIEGVRIALSRDPLPRTSTLNSSKNRRPGPDPSKAVFLFFSDQEGVVKIDGPPPGKYHFRALAPSNRLSMIRGCDKNLIFLPSSPVEIIFGWFWAVAVKIKNDEILSFRKTKPKGQTLRFSGILDMRLMVSSLSEKYQTPLVWAGIPSKPGIAPSILFQVWLKKAGKREFRVRLRRLDDSFKPLVYSFPPKKGGAFGEVLIQTDPSFPFLRKIPLEAVVPSKTSPLPMVSRKIVFGKKMALPPGEYKILSWGRYGQEVLSRALDPDHFTVKIGKTTKFRMSLKEKLVPIKIIPINEDGSRNRNVALFFKKNGLLKWYTKWDNGRYYYLTCGLWEIKFYGRGAKKDSVFVDVRPSRKPIVVELHLRKENGE